MEARSDLPDVDDEEPKNPLEDDAELAPLPPLELLVDDDDDEPAEAAAAAAQAPALQDTDVEAAAGAGYCG